MTRVTGTRKPARAGYAQPIRPSFLPRQLKQPVNMKKENNMKKFMTATKNKADSAFIRVKNVLANERGDFYISDGVKIIIAVVLGALLLAALTGLFNNTVIPRITQEIQNLFA